MNTVENLRKSIYELMIQNNITCHDFGKALGYSINDVDRILFGELLLPPIEIQRIAELFGMTKSELIHYQERNNGKAFLIIDMQEECNTCPCFQGYDILNAYCGHLKKVIEFDDENGFIKPDWCELKTMNELM